MHAVVRQLATTHGRPALAWQTGHDTWPPSTLVCTAANARPGLRARCVTRIAQQPFPHAWVRRTLAVLDQLRRAYGWRRRAILRPGQWDVNSQVQPVGSVQVAVRSRRASTEGR